MKLHNSFMCLETSYMFQNLQNSFFLFVWGGGGIGGRAERERKGWLGQQAFFSNTCNENSVMIINIGT